MITIIIGARPQFIKHWPLQESLQNKFETRIIHTGQHYDKNMSEIFFKEMGIQPPDIHLEIGSGTHGEQTAKMLSAIERDLIAHKPSLVIVYGDTNSTLAGALAAAKLHIPVAHIEAGLRSFNKFMPEEINRIMTDHISEILFTPSEIADKNLQKEGITKNVYRVGDIMFDALNFFLPQAEHKKNILKKMKLKETEFYYSTIHRPSNTDSETNLRNIVSAFSNLDKKVVFAIHPRTLKMIKNYNIKLNDNICIMNPLGYLENLVFLKYAKAIITDSGGMQKESFFLKVPCITIRQETEWVETIKQGWNCLVNPVKNDIIKKVSSISMPKEHMPCYGNGNTSTQIINILLSQKV